MYIKVMMRKIDTEYSLSNGFGNLVYKCVYECLSTILKVFVMKKHLLSVEFAVFKVELFWVKGIKEI